MREGGDHSDGLEVGLWRTKDKNNDSQVWEFKPSYLPRSFKLNCAYMIINIASGTSASLEDDDDYLSLVGSKRSDRKSSQKWIFQNAHDNQVYIKNLSSEIYLSIDGTAPGNGTKILCAEKKQAWDVRPDANDPKNFRIFYPNTVFNINLENGDKRNGTQIQLDEFNQGSDSQKWEFDTPSSGLIPSGSLAVLFTILTFVGYQVYMRALEGDIHSFL